MCFNYISRFILIICCLFIGLSTQAQTPNSWRQVADFPDSVRYGAVGFSINGKGYVFGGKGKGQYEYLNDLWEYDPATNKWTKKASMPARGRFTPIAFVIGGKAYVGTGDLGGTYYYMQDLWEYDPATDKWTQKTDFPGGKRGEAVSFTIGNKGYVGTGMTYESFSTGKADFWEYDPATDQWTRKADFGGGKRWGAVGFSIGNKGYVGTGQGSGATKDFWEYDPVTDVWTRKADVGGQTRWTATGFGLDNTGYIGLGITTTQSNDFWEYKPDLNTWTQKAALTTSGNAMRECATAFNIGNKGYVGAGNMYGGDGLHKDFWEYQYDHYIITDTVKGGPFCGNTIVKIPFKSSVTFNPGNVFTAQLSDPAGGFSAPINIGTLTGVLPDTIIGTIPNAVPSGNYKIRVVSSSPSIVNSDGATPVVIHGTMPAIHITADKDSICRGEKVTFTATTVGGGNPVFYWKKNYLVMTGYGAVYTDSTLNENDQVSCTVQTDVSCIGNKQAQSNVVIIGIRSWVTPTVTIAAARTMLCAGIADTFYATGTKEGSNPTYQWRLNNANVGTDSTVYIIDSLNDGDQVSCTMTSSEMCADPRMVNSNSIGITVRKVTLFLTALGPTDFCAGGSVTLKAIANTQTAHYDWIYNTSTPIGTNTPSFSAINAGRYKVKVYDTASQCIDTVTSMEQVVAVTPSPLPKITQSGNILSTGKYAFYQWYNNGSPISGAIDQTYTVTEEGVYAVWVAYSNNCSNFSPSISPVLNVADHAFTADISIYPNPAHQKIFVKTPVPVSLSLYDLAGRAMIQKENVQELNAEGIAPGVYILRINDKAGNLLKIERVSIM